MPLVVLAHVDPDRACRAPAAARGVDLGDLGLGPLQEFPVGGHDFINGSWPIRHSRYVARDVGGDTRAAAGRRRSRSSRPDRWPGVVLATRQDPAQPTAQCDGRAKALLVPGVTSPDAAGRPGRARPAAEGSRAGARAARPATHRTTRWSQFNYGERPPLRRVLRGRRARRFAQAKKAGHDTYYEMRADCVPASAVLPAEGRVLSDLPADSSTTRCSMQGVLLQRQRPPALAPRSSMRARHGCTRTTTRRRSRRRSGGSTRTTSRPRSRTSARSSSASRSSQTVRYHLGLLLAWTGQRDQAVKEFRRVARSRASDVLWEYNPPRSCGG